VREDEEGDVPVLDVLSQRHRLVHQIQTLSETPRNARERNDVFREVRLPPRVPVRRRASVRIHSFSGSRRGGKGEKRQNAPLCNLLQIRPVRTQPSPQRLSPLREELGLQQLTEHLSSQQRRPLERADFERGEVLLTRVDGEVGAEVGAESGEDVAEEEGVPVGFGEGLQRKGRWREEKGREEEQQDGRIARRQSAMYSDDVDEIGEQE
jgi:hypothetical protein